MTLNNNPNDPNIDGVRGREATPEEIARRDGYVQGRNDENVVQGVARSRDRAVAQAAANDGAASGLVVGLIIALLAAGVGAAVYFLADPDPTPVVAPEVEREPQVQKEIIREKETTVIERDNSAPAPAPDVNISVPETPAPDVNIINQEPAPAEPETAAEPASTPEAAAESPATGAPAEGTN